MNENKIIPDWAWALYQAKQEEALNCSNDATEESLNFLLRTFNAGKIPEHTSILKQMLDNHLAGNRQKVRRRLRLLENNADLVFCSDRPTNQTSDCLDIVRRNVHSFAVAASYYWTCKRTFLSTAFGSVRSLTVASAKL